jgi:hypothetical protein
MFGAQLGPRLKPKLFSLSIEGTDTLVVNIATHKLLELEFCHSTFVMECPI